MRDYFSISEEEYRECIARLGKSYWEFNAFGETELDNKDKFDIVLEFGSYDEEEYGTKEEMIEKIEDEDEELDFFEFLREADIDYFEFGKVALFDGYLDEINYDENNSIYYYLCCFIEDWKSESRRSYEALLNSIMKKMVYEYYDVDFECFNLFYFNIHVLERKYLESYKKEKNQFMVRQELLNEYSEDLDNIYTNKIELDEFIDENSDIYAFIEPILYKVDGHTLKDLATKRYLDDYKTHIHKIVSLLINLIELKLFGSTSDTVNPTLYEYILRSKALGVQDDCLKFIRLLSMEDFEYYNGRFVIKRFIDEYAFLGLDVENYRDEKEI